MKTIQKLLILMRLLIEKGFQFVAGMPYDWLQEKIISDTEKKDNKSEKTIPTVKMLSYHMKVS